MLKVRKSGTNRLDIELDGKLDSAGMQKALDELVEMSGDIEEGRMLYRIGRLEIPTAGAIVEELTRLPELFALVRRFEKAAVIAEQRWVRKISALEGALIPGLEIKAFTPGEIEAAEAWLSV